MHSDRSKALDVVTVLKQAIEYHADNRLMALRQVVDNAIGNGGYTMLSGQHGEPNAQVHTSQGIMLGAATRALPGVGPIRCQRVSGDLECRQGPV